MACKSVVFLLMAVFILPTLPAPYRSKSRSSPTYDQKQTGDYNIQLHLKDFQIVALLSDGLFGDLGDYDYNYDYSDLTIRPSPSPITTPATSTSSKPEDSPTKQPPTTLNIPQTTTTVKAPTTTSTTTTNPTKTTTQSVKTTQSAQTTTPKPTPPFNGEQIIPVQIISSLRSDEKIETIKDSGVPKPNENVTVVEKDHVEIPQRKCAQGFTRDKQGRCRRVRRPASQLPFGITQLASLASKLRQATGDTQPSLSVRE